MNLYPYSVHIDIDFHTLINDQMGAIRAEAVALKYPTYIFFVVFVMCNNTKGNFQLSPKLSYAFFNLITQEK